MSHKCIRISLTNCITYKYPRVIFINGQQVVLPQQNNNGWLWREERERGRERIGHVFYIWRSFIHVNCSHRWLPCFACYIRIFCWQCKMRTAKAGMLEHANDVASKVMLGHAEIMLRHIVKLFCCCAWLHSKVIKLKLYFSCSACFSTLLYSN